MGLIQAGLGAAGGALADQWKEYFYCEAIPSEVLVTKGQKRTGGRSANTKGTDNIISQGSVIAVADGQCMIIVDQGRVAELCAEPGEFIYDNSTSPTIFSGKLSQSIPAVFKDIGKRFTFGGEPPKDQRVYYFNTKEILGNKYGTSSPVPFRVIDARIDLDLDAQIRCSGTYTYRITNPILFYTNVCANVSTDFTRNTDDFDKTLKDMVVSKLREALARISAIGVRYSELPAHEKDLRDALNEELSAEWRDLRGIEIVSFTMPNAQVTEDYLDIIKEKQKDAVLMNTNMAAATLVGAQADAMKAAARNEGGAMTGFLGLGMAQNTGGNNAQTLFQMGQQQQPQQQQQPISAAQAGWTCSCGHAGNTGKFCAECAKPKPQESGSWTCSCGAVNTGKFCAECAKPKPADESWTCSCGTVNKGKFCAECAKPKPAGTNKYKCDKCGWEPEDPTKPPKFCPECADPFDDRDIV
jgi:membrane protease subunit (stomatin/prohibitin family)